MPSLLNARLLRTLVAFAVLVTATLWAEDATGPACHCPPAAVSFQVTRGVANNLQAKSATSAVAIQGFAFQGGTITITVGDTVKWTNNDGTEHTSTSDASSGAEVWNSGSLLGGATFSHTFHTAGSYPYHCVLHSFMTGTVVVQAPVPAITSAPTASVTVSTPFFYQITATNSPTTFGATGLPAGLNLNATSGVIAGTPSIVGNTTVPLTATNANGTGAPANLVISVLPPHPVITSPLTASGQVGQPFTYQITASNSPTSFATDILPTGLSVNAVGLISGTPAVAFNGAVIIHAANAGGNGNANLNLTILPAAPVITSATAATATIGTMFTYQIAAANAPASFGAANLPGGLSVDASGLISGTPTGATVAAVTVSATNTGGTGSATLTLTVNPPPPVITSTAAVGGTVGSTFAYQILATNAPTSYGASGLPGGLSVSATSGAITGIPTASGSATVALTATNAGGTGTATLAVSIAGSPNAPAVTSSGSASAHVGSPFTYQIAATNVPTAFTASGLPGGLTISAGGLVSGTPTATGVVTITVTATNGFGTGTASVILTVLPAIPVITSPTSASLTQGTAFSYQIAASGAPTGFGASPLPAGMFVSAGGLISGTPTALGITSVTVTATNAGGTGSAVLVLTVLPPPPVITSAVLASTLGSVVSYQITATNNPTSFAAFGLPAGVTINTATGLITGSVVPGTYTVTVSATNAGGTGNATVTFSVPTSGTATAGTAATSTAGGTSTAGTASAGTTAVATTAAGGGGGGGCGLGAGLAALFALVALRRRR